MVSIDQNKCIGCGLCVKDCLFGVLSIKDEKAAASSDCFECGHCVAICPKNAVSIPALPMEEVREYDESCRMDPENLLHFMQFRRSIRQFRQEPIPRKLLENMLEAGRYTPTASNRQDVSYIIVQDKLEELKDILWKGLRNMVETTGMGPYTDLMRAFCEEHDADPNKDRLFCHATALLLIFNETPMNNGLAATSMELMAQAQGVGALYSGFLQRIIMTTPAAKEFLGIDNADHLSNVMLLGLADVKYQRTAPRKKVNISWK